MQQVFLFLQCDASPFAERVAEHLDEAGATVLKLHLNPGDNLFWHRPGALHYRGRFSRWRAHVARVMERHAITDLFLTGEQRPHHRVAIEEAARRGIAVTVHDLGYLRPDWIALEQDGMATWSRFPRDPTAIKRLAASAPSVDLTVRFRDSFLHQAAGDVAYHLSTSLLWFLYPFYRSFQPTHPVINYLGTLARLATERWRERHASACIQSIQHSGRPWFVFAMQMEADFSVRAYSRYRGMREPLAEAIASFARDAPGQAILVVKLHPLDPGLRAWSRFVGNMARRAGADGRVMFIDGGSLDHLLPGAAGVVTVNSTVGIWALRAGVPVAALGDAVYRVAGLAHQGPLDTFWRAPSRPDSVLVAAFVRAIADALHVRGVFYAREGREAAAISAARRLRRTAMACTSRMVAAADPAHPRFAPIPGAV